VPDPTTARAAGKAAIGEGDRRALLTANTKTGYALLVINRRSRLGDKTDVLHGALDLMVLRALDALGSQHGYGVARRIEQMSEGALALNQGTLYPALLRLEQQRWISSRWGVSENNRRARFYSITARGRKRLAAETERWEQLSALVARFLRPAGEAS
jgi:PadR family transcriptional regulator, regulatory protein PadR